MDYAAKIGMVGRLPDATELVRPRWRKDGNLISLSRGLEQCALVRP